MKTIPIAILCATAGGLALAAPRSSVNYTITTDTADAGGLHAASANYGHDGSTPGFSGISSAGAPGAIAKQGYLGQLYQATGLTVLAPAAEFNEGETLQLGASYLLDDDSLLSLPPASVEWSVVSGPITGIDGAGLATAGLVYEDTSASVGGSLGGFTGSLDLTVPNSLPDNFGSYAGDGLDDGWQQQYFGFDNPDAAPGLDPDGDGQDNAFEFAAGLIPINPLSRFLLRTEAVPGEAGQMVVIFSPRLTGRSYGVEFSADLAAGLWLPLEDADFIDEGEERRVSDLNASAPSRFYRVIITRP